MDHRKECRIYTMTGEAVGGFLSGSHVYPDSEVDLYHEFLSLYLLQIESGGKWGLMNVETNELAISLQFDYIHPMFSAKNPPKTNHAKTSHAVKNALHGYINVLGETVIPFVYEDACHYASSNGYFAVKRGKWGVVNRENEPILPFVFDRIDLDSCFDRYAGGLQPYAGISAIRDGYMVLFDMDGEILEDHLTAQPCGYSTHGFGDYMLLQRKRKFGVACRDGRLITNITMLKREAMHLIRKLEGAC
ncbi:WG repeat-containing protein [Caproiciproducens sp. CPB-2]|uniref:WG repeat-containing protein n=1 Tax=Caproiciproducens sp. CPB-2 TaxID=3030017 RepID=UPI0023DB1C88|nr:WG repeat-containing protein [Caproiciproducens sp. CPB-2]MDF1494850.1 WG repeat-containing protein [Caproiciproducens sp. CPB-2]